MKHLRLLIEYIRRIKTLYERAWDFIFYRILHFPKPVTWKETREKILKAIEAEEKANAKIKTTTANDS